VGSFRQHWQAVVALATAAVLWGAHDAAALPWPRASVAALSALFVLVAVTRVTGDMGMPFQRRLRYAVAGVAIAAGSWFAGLSVVSHRPELLLLGGLHIAAAWLAAYGEPDAAERRRGILVLAGAMIALSVIALAAGSLAAYAPMFATTGVVGAAVLVIGILFVRAPEPPAPRQ